MKLFTKAALGALMLAGAAAFTAAPAEARVTVGIGLGDGYYGPRVPAYCDPYSRWYDPYRCDDYDNYDAYDGPVFIDGIWLNGGFRSRWYGGHRQFYYHGGWHGGSGWHDGGFGHGGHGGGGHGGGGHWGGGHGGGGGGHHHH
ncbi:MAG: hypothetical protein WDM91_08015 [Rhizomicrobium sp.]